MNLTLAHRTMVEEILRHHLPGRTVWAFGSRVTGTSKESADLDLAILGDAPLPLALMADLRTAFEESDLPFRVDLVDMATASASFRAIIEAVHRVVQEGENGS